MSFCWHRWVSCWRFMPNPKPGKWHGVWTYLRTEQCWKCDKVRVPGA